VLSEGVGQKVKVESRGSKDSIDCHHPKSKNNVTIQLHLICA